jgi:DNA-binding response OmpR family regulator
VQGTRILLLEDDRETRWALATVLRREGCRVTEASNGEEGLKALGRGAFDLCISDVCMPGMGGFGFFAAVRFGDDPALAGRKAMPILLLSGKVPTRELAQALDAGVDEFMEKPVDPEEFKARVRALIRRARSSAASTARTAGDLADFSITALAQTLNMSGRSARLRVTSGTTIAVLDFVKGSIRNATIQGAAIDAKGDTAALEALAIQTGKFELLPAPDNVPSTVSGDTPGLMLRAATRSDEIALQVQATASLAASAVKSAAAAASESGFRLPGE